MHKNGQLGAQNATNAMLLHPTQFETRPLRFHPHLIKFLNNNVQNMKRRCSSRLHSVPDFKPIHIQFHLVPIQFLTQISQSNKFLLSPAHSQRIPTASLLSSKLVFPLHPWWLLLNSIVFLLVLITVHCFPSTHYYTLCPAYPSNVRQS